MPSYFLVRSPAKLVAEGLIGYGWSAVNFSEFTSENELIADFKAKKIDLGRRENQIRRYFKIAKGDVVLVPSGRSIFIGIVEGKKSYQPGVKNGENRISVAFFKDQNLKPLRVSRNELPGSLSSRLKIQSSVNRLDNFKADIDRIIATSEAGGIHPANLHMEELNEKAEIDFKKRLLSNIRQRKTYLKSGGRGLEELVCELVKLEGYDSKIAAKNANESIADVDIEARRTDKFISFKLLIQVKHHDGQTDGHGIKQLAALEASDDKIVFKWLITTGAISEQVREEAERHHISVMDGDKLIEWIFESLPKLSPKTRENLGISDVPTLLL